MMAARPRLTDGKGPAKSSPTWRDQQRELTREQLLSAARSEFAKVGYSLATVDSIVAAAGVVRATFYLHFSNKDKVVEELLRPMHEDAQITIPEYVHSLNSASST